ncbi:hypothetical protein BJ742DRAFT_773537 [Cladochytrium replicatum]|nr:hypothetical protein BJ742DRAFT_773537 [Cladochytrium replicatum]
MPVVLRIVSSDQPSAALVIPAPEHTAPTSQTPSNIPPRRVPRTLSFRGRLAHELAEFQREPYRGIEFHWIGHDPQRPNAPYALACLVLTPLSGPFKGIGLHFRMTIPENYPDAPPTVSIDNNVRHPHVYGNWICCDILFSADSYTGTYGQPAPYSGGYSGGYTPAYTLLGVTVQMLSFFTDYKIPNDHGGVSIVKDIKSIDEAVNGWNGRRFSCEHCGYSGDEIAKEMGEVVERRWKKKHGGKKDDEGEPSRVEGVTVGSETEVERTTNGVHDSDNLSVATQDFTSPAQAKKNAHSFKRVPDEIWLKAFEYLSVEAIGAAAVAFEEPFGRIARAYNIQRRRELCCFYSREPFTRTILGFGVYYDEERQRLTSEFDFLSWRAFHDDKVRMSVWKKPFQFWIPFTLHSQHHFERVVVRLRASTRQIGEKVLVPRYVPTVAELDYPEVTLRLLIKMMNHMVVSLFDVASDSNTGRSKLLMASEKAVEGYIALLHLALCMLKKFLFLQTFVDDQVRHFMERRDGTLKSSTPDLGEWLIWLGLSTSGQFNRQIARRLLPEFLSRNVLWMVRPRVKQRKVTVRHNEDDDYSYDDYISAPTSTTRTETVREASPYAHLLFLECDPICPIRLTDTFEATSTSLRLLLFQVFFLTRILRPPTRPGGPPISLSSVLTTLDKRLGQPPETLITATFNAIGKIQAVNDFRRFFGLLGAGYERTSRDDACEILRKAIRDSAAKGYHRASYGYEALQTMRAKAVKRRCQ